MKYLKCPLCGKTPMDYRTTSEHTGAYPQEIYRCISCSTVVKTSKLRKETKEIKKLERCPVCDELMNLFIDEQSFIGIVCPNHGYYHGWRVVFYE
jgi:uncharacterized C2H2 Zn-finger protein